MKLNQNKFIQSKSMQLAFICVVGVGVALLVFSLGLISSAYPAKTAKLNTGVSEIQKVFKSASLYTVKVRTRIPLPFILDEQGIYNGSGFLVDKKRAWIVTVAHTASRSPSEIKIKFSRGKYLKAKKVYVDPLLDLAILALNPSDLPKKSRVAKLNCTNIPSTGLPVAAFGYPAKIKLTGTRGVISGVLPLARHGLMLQTDAPLLNGTYGGPLISLVDGKVIGISTSSKSKAKNLNYSSVMKHVCDILDLLKKGKDPSPPILPYDFYADLDEKNKLIVAHVDKKQDRLKLKMGDTILRVNKYKSPISHSAYLIHLLRGNLEKVRLEVKRNNKTIVRQGKLLAMNKVTSRYGVLLSGALYGKSVWKFSNNYAIDKPAVIVHNVKAGSRSEFNRISKFDFVVSVNGEKITSLDQFYCVILKAKGLAATAQIDFLAMRRSKKVSLPFQYKSRQIKLDAIQIIADQHAVNTTRITKKASLCAKQSNTENSSKK